MFIKILNRFIQFVNASFYNIYYKKMTINPSKSFFSGTVFINCNGSLSIGDGFRNRQGMTLNANGGIIEIGCNVFFNKNVSINAKEKIIIGNNILFGEGVKIYDHDHDYKEGFEKLKNNFISKPVYVGDNVWIGSDVIILNGVSIGSDSIIGAGSIITKDVPRNTILIQKRESILTKIKV